MKRIEKTVFISYRRTNAPWALAIYQHLRNDYDIFFDFNSLPSGDFEQVIIQSIKARAHFIVLLTPSALERCDEPDDWLRREIECALDNKRNIIPLMLEGFDFSTPVIAKHLTGKLELLKKYNAMMVTFEYFDAAMERLRKQFLSMPLHAILHPVLEPVKETVQTQKSAANAAALVSDQSLSGQQWFEEGYLAVDPIEKIRCYSKAIELQLDDVFAYISRGISYANLGQHERAIEDYDKAIQIAPELGEIYFNRGNSYADMGKFERAINDYDKAIYINPYYADAYNNRGNSYALLNQYKRAIADYDKAIQDVPDDARFYYNRGISYADLGKHELAIKDYAKVMKLNPEDARAVFSTARSYALLKQVESARSWLRRAIEMDSKYVEEARANTDFGPIRG